MNDYNKLYEKIKNISADTYNKLKNKEMLSENECVTLIKWLTFLPDLPQNNSSQINDSLVIDNLYGEFVESEEKLERIIKKIYKDLSSGYAPNYNMKNLFDESYDNALMKYECFYNKIVCYLSDEELPETGSTVNNYYEAYKNSNSYRLKQQINEIIGLLRKFISIKSKIEKTSVSLKQFQDDAEKLIEYLGRGGKVKSIDEINEEINGIRIFLKAFESPDLNNDEGNEMLDELEERYKFPSRITRGLITKSYYIEG